MRLESENRPLFPPTTPKQAAPPLLAALFSSDPQRRQVERELLARWTDELEAASAVALLATDAPAAHPFERDLSRMQHPVFQRLARALEKPVPQDTGFGRFRDSA